MVKILGGILIIFSSYFFGKSVINNKTTKYKFCEDMISLFKTLKEQLSTNFTDISEAILISCEKCDFVYKNDFVLFANTIQKCDVNTFKQAYENSKKDFNDVTLSVISEFAIKLDENGLMYAERAVSDMINQLCKSIECEKLKFVSDCKIIMSLSIFMGIFIVIILI